MTTKTEPPKRKKNASKKSKKSWRKNTDIDDVEEFLEEQRLEERLGGAFKDRADEELFVVDKGETDDDEKAIEEKLPPRLLRRKKAHEKPLRCFQNLEITNGVKDPKKGRNRRKTPLERQNPTVKAAEKERISKGIKK